MVNPLAVILVGAGAIVFLGAGGVQFVSNLLPKFGSKDGGSQIAIPTSQGGGKIGSEIPEGSTGAVNTIKNSSVIQTNITNKSNAALTRGKATDLVINQTDLLRGSLQTNLSTGAVTPLTQQEFEATISRPLTAQELSDIEALNARRARKGSKQGLKASGATVVAQKRIQEALAVKNVFDSRTVQNTNFDLGLPSNATQADRQRAIAAQAERRAQLQKQQANAVLQAQRQQVGSELIKQTGSTAEQQKIVLLNSGINLTGGALNEKALARLREQGLI